VENFGVWVGVIVFWVVVAAVGLLKKWPEQLQKGKGRIEL
jgi:hypothetical protein